MPLDGTYYLTADGTAERPIVIKGAGDGDAIFDGAGNFALFDVRAADYTYFEGLTFRNADYRASGRARSSSPAPKGLTVRSSRFEDVGAGVFTNYSGSSNFYIADNYFIGRDDPDHVIGWSARSSGRQFNGVDGPEVSAGDGLVRRGQGLRPRPRHRLQLRRATSTTASTSRPTAIRTARRRSTARSIRRRHTGTGGRSRSTSTTTT